MEVGMDRCHNKKCQKPITGQDIVDGAVVVKGIEGNYKHTYCAKCARDHRPKIKRDFKDSIDSIGFVVLFQT